MTSSTELMSFRGVRTKPSLSNGAGDEWEVVGGFVVVVVAIETPLVLGVVVKGANWEQLYVCG